VGPDSVPHAPLQRVLEVAASQARDPVIREWLFRMAGDSIATELHGRDNATPGGTPPDSGATSPSVVGSEKGPPPSWMSRRSADESASTTPPSNGVGR